MIAERECAGGLSPPGRAGADCWIVDGGSFSSGGGSPPRTTGHPASRFVSFQPKFLWSYCNGFERISVAKNCKRPRLSESTRPIQPGACRAERFSEETKANKAGTGEYLALVFRVEDDEYRGQRIRAAGLTLKTLALKQLILHASHCGKSRDRVELLSLDLPANWWATSSG
jgi:hypothetical protein